MIAEREVIGVGRLPGAGAWGRPHAPHPNDPVAQRVSVSSGSGQLALLRHESVAALGFTHEAVRLPDETLTRFATTAKALAFLFGRFTPRWLALGAFSLLAPSLLTAAEISPAAPAPASSPVKSTSDQKVPPGRLVALRMRDGLRFDPARFSAQPGELVSFLIENADTTGLTHNFLLLKPGRRDDVVQQALALGEQAMAKNFIPATADVLFSAPLLGTDGVTAVSFTMPAEPGIYPYVCTFPGHGVMMYGAAYVGVPEPDLSADKNVPSMALESSVAGNGRRPFVQRMFLPDSGPASIAVALVGNQNFCWDAGECRLRYAWQGTFIDAAEHWNGKGGQLAKIAAQPWWQAGKGERALRVGVPSSTSAPAKFLGYALNAQGPEFHYRLGATEVFEQVVPARGGPGLSVEYRIPAAAGDVFYDVPPAEKDSWSSSAGSWDGPVLHLTAAQAKRFTLTFTTPLCRP